MDRALTRRRTSISAFSADAGAHRPNLLYSFALAGAVALHAVAFLALTLPVRPFERGPMAYDGEFVVVPRPVVRPPIIICHFGPRGVSAMPVPDAEARDAARRGVTASVSPVPVASLLPEAADPGPRPERYEPQPNLPVRLLVAPAPAYPLQALRAGLSGSVEIEVVVGIDGRPLRAFVVRSSGHRALDRAALATVLREWRFQPQTHGGEAVEAVARVPVEFVLPRGVARG
ncbi:energy transducer TonB [Lysobacter enzymogenes]|uniref:energy transducer TonB n=1 Tax=Lysobacter enzymogenes TaxID=69 RepID=UPI0038502195